MPLILSGNVATATADVAFSVDNSLRFNSADSANLDLTDPVGNNYYANFTFSFWVKRCKLGSEQFIIQSSQTSTKSFGGISFGANDALYVQLYDSTSVLQFSLITNRLFRDVSAWYHIMVAFDLADGTAADRIKIYVNGTRETSFATETMAGAGFGSAFFIDLTDPVYIGSGRNTSGSTVYSDFYLAQFLCVTADSGDTDGLNADAELIPTQVGEFNSDTPTVWQPIEIDTAVLGASLDMSDNLGTNGFFLDFKDSANLGNDVNGGTDWDENNIAATDQATDTPTNNFSTMNPLDKKTGGTYTFAEGNLEVQQDISRGTLSTFAVAAGKWYAEAKFISTSGSDCVIGVIGFSNTANEDPGIPATGYVYNQDGTKKNSDTDASFGDSYTTGDIVGIALDLTNLKIYFAKNGTWQDSGDPTSGGTGTGAAYTITAPASTPSGFYFFTHADELSTNKVTWNFGNPPYANSSSVADGN